MNLQKDCISKNYEWLIDRSTHLYVLTISDFLLYTQKENTPLDEMKL